MKVKAKAKEVLRFGRHFVRAREAVSALEYAILVGVIVAAVATALVVFSGNISQGINKIGDKIKAPTGVTAPDLS